MSRATRRQVEDLSGVERVAESLVSVRVSNYDRRRLSSGRELLGMGCSTFMGRCNTVASGTGEVTFESSDSCPLLYDLRRMGRSKRIGGTSVFCGRAVGTGAIVSEIRATIRTLGMSIGRFKCMGLTCVLSVCRPSVAGTGRRLTRGSKRATSRVAFDSSTLTRLEETILIRRLSKLVFLGPSHCGRGGPSVN